MAAALNAHAAAPGHGDPPGPIRHVRADVVAKPGAVGTAISDSGPLVAWKIHDFFHGFNGVLPIKMCCDLELLGTARG